jgi:hypothetical protein
MELKVSYPLSSSVSSTPPTTSYPPHPQYHPHPPHLYLHSLACNLLALIAFAVGEFVTCSDPFPLLLLGSLDLCCQGLALDHLHNRLPLGLVEGITTFANVLVEIVVTTIAVTLYTPNTFSNLHH